MGGNTTETKDKGETIIAYAPKEGPRLSEELKSDISVMTAVVAEIELRIAEIMAYFEDQGMSPFVEPNNDQGDLISWWGELHHQQSRLINAQQRLNSLLLESLEESISRLDSSIQTLNESSKPQRRGRLTPKGRPFIGKK
ncbi:MAG: hypothetical protein ABSB29_03185 [Nitrososphaerales archaeon]